LGRRTVGRRPVILCRKEDGGFSVLLNRCTRRGALVCRTPRGNARHFTCGYYTRPLSSAGPFSSAVAAWA